RQGESAVTLAAPQPPPECSTVDTPGSPAVNHGNSTPAEPAAGPATRLDTNEAIYERGEVKQAGAENMVGSSRTSPSPSASVDLAHLRPRDGPGSCTPNAHLLSPRLRDGPSASITHHEQWPT